MRMFEDNERLLEELITLFYSTICTWSNVVDFNGMALHDFLVSLAPS